MRFPRIPRRLIVLALTGCAAAVALTGAAAAATAQECMDCHGDKSVLQPVTPGRTADSLVVATDKLKGSVHKDLGCADCHVAASTEGTTPHYEKGGSAPTLGCGNCHDDALKDYLGQDIHGTRRREGSHHAPFCNDCHGGHDIVPLKSPDSLTATLNQPKTCGRCHESEDLVDSPGIAKRKLVERYQESVHWKGLSRGEPAASCTSCHGHHKVLPSSNPDSSVTRTGQITTCAKCHPEIARGFAEGTHGMALLSGNLDVPTCTTCHGDHDMMSLKTQVTGQRDFASVQVCMWCHGNERMMDRYALDTTPVQSYLRDFHGMAQRGSFSTVATCADCHEAHRCLPSSHPGSRMHISNRGAACGQCHGQSSDTFAMTFTHKKASDAPAAAAVEWVTIIYVVLILVTIGGMLLHNAAIWMFFARRKLRHQEKHGNVRRLTRGEIKWHWIMLTAFTMLAVTGFALTFSESPFVRWAYEAGLTESTRAFLHRLFAVMLLLDMGLFFFYTVLTKQGRSRWWKEMWPRIQDVKDFFATMSYYAGSSKQKPRYPVFNYAEKAEYWALWWGIVTMGLSGLVLWFSDRLPPDTPHWVVPVAKVVHFYEAVLAVLAIIVWHLFHTIFHPEEYPIGTSFMTGRLTEEEAHERFTPAAVEVQKMLDAEHNDVPPAPARPGWHDK
jgi:cytochrome b subunit of formate dehydrogenase